MQRMDKSGVEAVCRRVAGEIFGVDPQSLGADSRASTVASWDSLALVRLILALENALDVRLSLRQIEGIASFGDIVALFADAA